METFSRSRAAFISPKIPFTLDEVNCDSTSSQRLLFLDEKTLRGVCGNRVKRRGEEIKTCFTICTENASRLITTTSSDGWILGLLSNNNSLEAFSFLSMHRLRVTTAVVSTSLKNLNFSTEDETNLHDKWNLNSIEILIFNDRNHLKRPWSFFRQDNLSNSRQLLGWADKRGQRLNELVTAHFQPCHIMSNLDTEKLPLFKTSRHHKNVPKQATHYRPSCAKVLFMNHGWLKGRPKPELSTCNDTNSHALESSHDMVKKGWRTTHQLR